MERWSILPFAFERAVILLSKEKRYAEALEVCKYTAWWCGAAEEDYDCCVYEWINDENASTIAKINQDRGGIAFPFASCKRTALFGAYDGHGEGEN